MALRRLTTIVKRDLCPPYASATDPAFESLLADRRRRLGQLVEAAERQDPLNPHAGWIARTYPVVGVLAPVMSSHEGKIEFPGDPMCLYSALSTAVSEVVEARVQGLTSQRTATYNDLCPQLGVLPDRAYRLNARDSGLRDYAARPLNTDQCIFDPRVWNEEIKAFFCERVLGEIRPKVVLISTVSPGHRYAIDMARQVRRLLPKALIVIGGRHVDETMHFNDAATELDLHYSSTLRAIDDGRVEPVVDFLVAGEAYWTVDRLMKAVSIAMDLTTKQIHVEQVIEVFDKLTRYLGPVPGDGVLAGLVGEIVHARPIRGPELDISSLPSPYRPFAIRARFPIFESGEGEVQRTAHMMLTTACPYHCNFCSEGVSVVGRVLRFPVDAVAHAVDRVFEYVSYGAEALFFDDSVFCGGNLKLAHEFCQLLIEARRLARLSRLRELLGPRWLSGNDDWQRLADLQWGAQLTADFLVTLLSSSSAVAMLTLMKEAGCTYLYIGIESMAEEVMQHVHKNLQRPGGPEWRVKVRRALEVAREVGIRVGSSVLFGLEGETRETIDETISQVAELIQEGLLSVASPNILTYHPGTEITRSHHMNDVLDYHSINIHNRPPYVYFEEAFPAVVSRILSEHDIWYIHHQTQARWGSTRNLNPMKPTEIGSAQG